MIAKQITFLSFVALIIGVVLWQAGKRALSKFKLAKATIVDHVFDENELTLFRGQQGINNDESGTFYPVIAFHTEKGEKITKELALGSNPPSPVGTELDVLYNPENPTELETYPMLYYKTIPKVLISLAILGLVIASLFFLKVISF